MKHKNNTAESGRTDPQTAGQNGIGGKCSVDAVNTEQIDLQFVNSLDIFLFLMFPAFYDAEK